MWGLIMCVEQEDGRGGNVIQMQYTDTLVLVILML